MELQEMQEIMAVFKTRYPNKCGLNITQIKNILDGELVFVKTRRNRFILMTKEEVAPGDKLDQHNAEIRRINTDMRRNLR